MNVLRSVLARVSAWGSKRRFASRTGRPNRILVLCGLVAGLTLGSATAANAQVWNFVYTGSGFSAAGTFTVGANIACAAPPVSTTCAQITSITGVHSLYGAITGPWYTSVASGPQFPGTNDTSDHIGMYFTASGINFGVLLFTGGGGGAYEYNYSTQAAPYISGSISSVPEIDASSGLGALAALFGILLVLREMFVRGRGSMLSVSS